MRIEQIRIGGFGKLQDFDTGPTPLGPLNVVLGPNEAGKSTLFSFLTTALYGFQPASRDRNPHVPWGAQEAGGSIRFRTHEGECVMLERRLRSTPSGRLTRGELTTELRNQPVPWVDHVPRHVFRQVFAVTLADLAGLDDDTWARIQDRVLGSMGASDLRSIRDVADSLESEAAAIWRPNRRGNQRLRTLQEGMRALRARRSDALERDRQIRTLAEERESVEELLRDKREDLRRNRVVVERMMELLPLKRQLDRVEALRRDGGVRSELTDLPENPQERIAALEEQRAGLERELAAIEEELAEPEALISAFGAEAELVLTHKESIAGFLNMAAAAESDRDLASRAERELRDLQHRSSTVADHMLATPADAAVHDAVSSVSIDLLRDRVLRYGALTREKQAHAARPTPEARSVAAKGPWAAYALAGGGAALLAWGLFGGPTLPAIIGAACLAAGLTLGLVERRKEARSPSAAAIPDDSARTLRAEIVDMVRALPLRDGFLDPPSSALVDGLSRLQSALVEWSEATRNVEALSTRLAAHTADARALAADLGWRVPSTPDRLAAELQRALSDAERARDRAEVARREQARLRRARDAAGERFESVVGELTELRSLVDRIAVGARIPAIDDVQNRIDAHRRADRIEEELERAHPDLVDLKARIREVELADVQWSIDEAELMDRKIRVEQGTALVEELVGRSKTLERDAAHLREMETVDAVDSEQESLRESEARLLRERDRKWVMAQLVRQADRTFREEHQPDLIRRASTYVSRLTDGRYDRMLVDERGGTDLFQLVGPDLPAPVPLARPISTGTLEQAYLSLRLAIVDHLDQHNERLPIFIDEAFVNWDARRRDSGLAVLAEVAETRQVFAFTCHPEMAARLEALGARTVRLRR